MLTPPPMPPRTEPYVAVEFDLLDDSGNPATILLCNRGTVTRTLAGGFFGYQPLLTGLPILLGATITVTQYGQPVRATPNGGAIQFRLSEAVWIYTAYHWIGRTFRVYEGSAANPPIPLADVDADMVLVYVGRVAGFTHDTITATVQTTDASLDIDNPLVTNFYDVTFPVAIQGLPRPTARGSFFSAQPVIADETQQLYEVQSLPQGLDAISEVRVGGVPWTQVVAPPAPGQWSPVNISGVFQRIQLGSPPQGQDVRVDGQAGSYTTGELITVVIQSAGGAVDAVALAALDAAAQAQQASLVTTTAPVNRLAAIDDFVNTGGCWWGFNPLGMATGAPISAPDPVGKYRLSTLQIASITLDTIQPLAWRLRIGSQRNWQPETAFDTAVLQSDVAHWSAPGLVYEPHYENPNALALETRAVDVPLLAGTSPNPADAANEQARLIAAWGGNRTVFNVTVWMRPDDITLYDTVEVDYMMVTGTFRIVSAIRAIGGGPATLQLWGTLGAVPPAPAPLPLPPAFVPPPGFVPPVGGSGPPAGGGGGPPPSPTPIVVLSPAAVSIQANSNAGTLLGSVHVTMSDGSPFTGSLSTSLISGPAGSTNYITTSTTVPPLVGPPGTALYSITQSVGPSYVGTLSPNNLQWWQASSATSVVPYTGHIAAPRPGASLYLIVQSAAGAPSYIGDLKPADLAWWQNNTTATVTPYVPSPALPPNVTAYVELSRALSTIDTGPAQFSVTATQAGQSGSATETVNVGVATPLYSIAQPNAPSYVGNLTPANVAWWQNNGAAGTTVVPYTGVLPTPRAGASLYQIIQPGSASDPLVPNYIGDLLPADVTWWQTQAGASVTIYNPVGAAAPPVL